VEGHACIVRWAVIERVVITCTSSGTLEDKVLEAILDDMRKSNVDRSLGLALGSAHMTGIQRRKVVDFMRDRKLKAVLLTDSAIVRGIMTALSWFNDSISGGGLNDLEQALDTLAIEVQQRAQVRRTALELRSEVSSALREHSGSCQF